MKTSVRSRPAEFRAAGQSIWLDHITRGLLGSGTLARYIDELSVTGLTSNPTIFAQAIDRSADYDASIRSKAQGGRAGESLFFELAIEDLARAADLFRAVHDATDGVDGWVSLEVSPALARDTQGTIAAARSLWALAARPNLFIKIPGTPEGIPAIEEAIYAGIPINVTLLFSPEQYLAAAEAYLRGIERRIQSGLGAAVASVASLFVSRWDVAVSGKAPAELRSRLGIAMARRSYARYRELLDSDRWQRLMNFGARPQRLLFASTGSKDPQASDLLYVQSLLAPHTVNTVPEKTLLALADHGALGTALARDGGDVASVLDEFRRAGFDLDALALQLQQEGAQAFVQSWDELLACIAEKGASLERTS